MENTIFEDWKNEGIKEGIKTGKKEVATNMKKLGANTELIKQSTGLTTEQINKL